jgi:hypothetical protein
MENSMLSLLNFLVCLTGGLICICRLGKMSRRVKPVILLQYAAWLMAFTLSGWSFTLHEPIATAQLFFGVAALAHQLSGFPAWRKGPPNYALRAGWDHVERRFMELK